MRRFEDLKVWRKAHRVVRELYDRTRGFPREEKFGLTSQLRRCAVSIPANIVEGYKRASRADYARYIAIAEGSAGETDYLVLLAMELGYLEAAAASSIRSELDEVMRMLAAIRLSLERGPRLPDPGVETH